MNSLRTAATREPSLLRDLISAARYYLGGRRGLLILAAGVIGLGLALNWSWLVAAGVAPILIGLAPCAVMCALGLCMNKMTARPGTSEASSQSETSETKASPELAATAMHEQERNRRRTAAMPSPATIGLRLRSKRKG